jgi:hypothetical protein
MGALWIQLLAYEELGALRRGRGFLDSEKVTNQSQKASQSKCLSWLLHL